MEKIPKKHLEFLEFVMNKINEGSSGWWQLDEIAEEYNKESIIKFSLDEVRDFAALYKNKSFKTSHNSDLRIFPLPEIKQAIKNHGSFSKYLKSINHKERKARNIKIAIKLSPLLVMVASLIYSVHIDGKNNKLNYELNKLGKEIIKKDSIILDLNKRLIKNDTAIIQ